MRRTALALAATLFVRSAAAQTAPDDAPMPPPPAPTPWTAPSPFAAPPPPTMQPEAPRISGAEIATIYATGSIYGLGLGFYIAGAAIRSDPGPHTAIIPALGLGAGIAVAALVHGNADVRRGRAMAVHAGMWLGAGAGLGIALATDADFDREEVNLGTHLMFLGPTVGMIAGAGIAAATDARPGSIGFTFSLGVWTGLTGALLEGAVREATPGLGGNPAAGLLIGEGVGIAAGMLLSRTLEPTAAQARWMDVGALVGGLSGLGIGLAANDDEGPLIGMAVGVVGGALGGYFLGAPSPDDRRRNRERDGVAGTPASVFVNPVRGGAVVGLSL